MKTLGVQKLQSKITPINQIQLQQNQLDKALKLDDRDLQLFQQSIKSDENEKHEGNLSENSENNEDDQCIELKAKISQMQKNRRATLVNVKGENISRKQIKQPSSKLDIEREKFIVKGDRISQEERIKNSGKEIIYPLFIIPCKSQIKQIWDGIMGLLVIYTSLVSPVDIAFEFADGPWKSFYVGFDYFLLSLFACDILISFRTSYYDDQLAEVVNSKMILKNYLKSYNFYVDLLSTIPISEISEASSGTKINSNFTRIIKQLKLFRILRLAKLTKFLQSEQMKTLFQILKMIFFFILLFHWSTCIWHYIARQDFDLNNQDDNTIWIPGTIRQLGVFTNSTTLTETYYVEISDFERYTYCLYSLINLILGNDMQPVNILQVIIGIFVAISGQFLMSLFFGEVSVIIIKLNAEQTEYTERLENLETKINQNKFPQYLKVRILEYFDYCWQKKISFDSQIDFSYFSKTLETQMHYSLKKEIIKGVPFFAEIDPNEVLWIIKSLKTEIYLPDDFIIRQGEIGDCMYFMTDGIVKVLVRNENTGDILLQFNLKKKSFFGEVALLTSSKRTSDVIAIDFSILECFTKASFNQLQEIFPDIQARLQHGLSHYKIKSIDQINSLLSKNPLFIRFQEEELKDFIKDFLDLKFVDMNKLILKPKKKTYAWYFIVTGSIYKMPQSQKIAYLLKKMLVKKQEVDISKYLGKLETKDPDEVLDVQILKSGDSFGAIPFPDQKQESNYYYVTQTGCQILVLTQDKLNHLKDLWEDYYNYLYEGNAQLSITPLEQQKSKINTDRNDRRSEFEQILDQFEKIVESNLQGLNTLSEKFQI